jgi:hypothetical protein
MLESRCGLIIDFEPLINNVFGLVCPDFPNFSRRITFALGAPAD